MNLSRSLFYCSFVHVVVLAVGLGIAGAAPCLETPGRDAGTGITGGLAVSTLPTPHVGVTVDRATL